MFDKLKIAPCLWFDGQAEEAVNLYLDIFENSRITDNARAGMQVYM